MVFTVKDNYFRKHVTNSKEVMELCILLWPQELSSVTQRITRITTSSTRDTIAPNKLMEQPLVTTNQPKRLFFHQIIVPIAKLCSSNPLMNKKIFVKLCIFNMKGCMYACSCIQVPLCKHATHFISVILAIFSLQYVKEKYYYSNIQPYSQST